MQNSKKVALFGSIRALTVSAMLTAISVVIGIFCKTALNFDGGLFRVTFENLPIILSGILYGPIVGGVVGACSDLVSYLLSSQVYPPNLIVTLGATLVGVMSGISSKLIVRKKGTLQIVVSGALAHIVGSMIVKPIGLYQFYGALVLLRIPLYMLIAPVEILLLCTLLKRKSFASVVGYVNKSKTSKMSYNDALDYIHKINWTFCNPGLERIRELCEALGNPQKSLKFIHVAGTNGKGSFCAMLSEVLKKSGYKVGTFTSPYVKEFNERMAINGEMISNDELVALVEKIKPIADKMAEKPTEFELITALAFEYFAQNGCDYVVLECGLGGRLDSTNIIDTPVLTVITGIDFDHVSILGDTIEKIAFEKAGIIKPGVPCLWCGENELAEGVIRARAIELGSELFVVDHSKTQISSFTLDGTVFDFGEYKNIYIPLLGEYQPFNASNVLTAVDILRSLDISIPSEAIYGGLAFVKWHARFEILSKNPLIIADGGHNPQGVKSAVDSVKGYFKDEKINVISGVMADKDYRYIAEQIGSIANEVYCIRPDNPRALDATEYSQIYKENGVVAYPCASVFDALERAVKASEKQGKALLCVGSLYMYSEICECLDRLDSLSALDK